MFLVGDWVTDKRGKTGFILSVYNASYSVKFIKSQNGNKLNLMSFVSASEIRHAPLEFIPNEDFINLALDTNDKDWFNYLTSKLPV